MPLKPMERLVPAGSAKPRNLPDSLNQESSSFRMEMISIEKVVLIYSTCNIGKMFKMDEEFSGYPFPEGEFYFNYGEEISVYPIP